LRRKELEVRHDIYTWDTLAWVLYRNGRFQEAAEAINKALGLHTNDSLLLFHAGMIYHSLGKDSDAEEFLNRALKTNPHFHVFHAEVATRTLEDIAQSHHREFEVKQCATIRAIIAGRESFVAVCADFELHNLLRPSHGKFQRQSLFEDHDRPRVD
jgi:tetratricopeptide (TPR) repeat protein